jgi:hypothetical protein
MIVSKGAGAPTGFRTPVSALRGPRPGPLDDGGSGSHSTIRVFKRQQREVLRDIQSVCSMIFFNHSPQRYSIGSTSTINYTSDRDKRTLQIFER